MIESLQGLHNKRNKFEITFFNTPLDIFILFAKYYVVTHALFRRDKITETSTHNPRQLKFGIKISA